MGTSNESNSQSRNDSDQESIKQNGPAIGPGSDLAANEWDNMPFSEHDPFSSARVDQAISESETFLKSLSIEPTGSSEIDYDSVKTLYQNAEERTEWSKTRKDGFRGILRLAVRTPPRAKRIL